MSRQWLATGVVEAPVNAVFATLLAAGPVAGAHHNPAHNTNAAVDSDGILRYQAPIGNPPNTATVEVDQNRHTLAIQGHWWYRGVYTVREDPRGSLVEYRVYNIATRGRWAVPLMQRRLPHYMRRDLATLLQTIGRHLDCPASPSANGDQDTAPH
jgi:hypothetical protein